VTALELAPDGSGYRMHKRFAKFINLPELLTMFRAVADVQTADTLKLPRPEIATGRPQIVAVPASEPLKVYIKTLTERAERLRTQRIDPSQDNMLKITGDGRKAALDMRLVEEFADPHGDTKLSRAVEGVHNVWQATGNSRSAWLVFCDLSTPDPSRFNVYDELRSRLIDSGIPQNEIAFVHDADTDGAKTRLFNVVNAGRVRIRIGSTEKMGAGTNVQRRLVPLHHLDAPWRPRDIEKREGRILRQGNLNSEVRIYRYVTEGSFDAYMWRLTANPLSRSTNSGQRKSGILFQLRVFCWEARTPLWVSDLGKVATRAESPLVRFSLSHFPMGGATRKLPGPQNGPPSYCDDARFVIATRSLATAAGASRLTMNIMTGLRSGAAFVIVVARPSPSCHLFLSPLHTLQLAGSQSGIAALLVEDCSLESAAPTVMDSDRVADPSTLLRWFRSLDCSQPSFSFLRKTLAAAAQCLARGEVIRHGALQLSWPTLAPFL
jgi:hypothetical protein